MTKTTTTKTEAKTEAYRRPLAETITETAYELGIAAPESLRDFHLTAPDGHESAIPSEDRDRLRDLIPDPRIGFAYVSRDVSGVTDHEVFAAAMDQRYNVMLAGPTGSAKTTAARAFAAIHGLPFVSVPVNGAMDPGTVWGRYVVTEARDLVWIDSPAALVLKHGGVLVFDEINMAPPRVLAAFHEVLDVRRSVTVSEHNGETLKASPAVLLVGTMNPGYDGTARLNPALARRFAWTLEWPYLSEVEEVIIASESLRTFAADVRAIPEIRTDLSTDALATFENTAGVLGVAFAASVLVSGFSETERAGVRRALDLHLPAISADLGATDSEGRDLPEEGEGE